MNARERLEQYLADVRRRLRAVVVARASAVVAITALLVTLIAVWVLQEPGFPPDAVLLARVALVVAILTSAGATLWRPLAALNSRNRSHAFERHLPTQGGRIETYLELAQRRAQGLDAPLIDLLAEDALAVAEQSPLDAAVPRRRLLVPASVGAAAVLALVVLMALGNSELGLGARHLWLGTPIPLEKITARQILVTPGNATVRRNQDVPIRAAVRGFKARGAEVFVRFADAPKWERAPMRAGNDGAFEFTLYALREPLRYYVASQGTKSAEHRITVVDVPRVERMRLTYTYPSWTGLASETDETTRDIRAVAGTKVSVEVQTSAPLDSPTLLVNGESSALRGDGAWSRGTLELTKPGHYRVSARVGDERVPLTDEHEISLIPDEKPTIEIAKPGRDWQASRIEEVPVRVHAQDDFRVQGVELHYSVNGGDWKVSPVEGRGKDVRGDTMLRLEEIGEAQQASGADAQATLTPGDIVTYYAVAKDRRQSAQTDLFMVQVQPFERRFTQGQGGSQGGGGAGDDEQNGISQRQREILLATWNLQRSQQDSKGREGERLTDNAHMLGELQGTLAEQARTLIERAQARGVDSADPRNRELIDNLEKAAEAMEPAAKHLSAVDFPQALPAEQKALQHLLRAEALYADIEVQFRNSNSGGGGGQAGRDLAEMFELEMDLDKNQYETESRAAGDESPQQLADAIRKLRELAKRQEQLAREAAQQQQVAREADRWRQEQLKRETEDLRKKLADLSRQNANSQASRSQGRQGQQGRAGQSGSEGQSASGDSAAEALAQVESALQNMEGAAGSAQGNAQPSSGARSAQAASRNLKQALEKIEQGRREGMAGAFDDLAERAKRLLEEQRRGESELLSAFSRPEGSASAEPNPQGARGAARPRGLSWERAEALAEQKRGLQNELESLQRDMQSSAKQHRDEAPQASSQVGEAATNLAESSLSAGLARSAMELERGRGLQAAGRERLITEAMEALETDLGQAARVAANEARQQRDNKNDATPEELLAELSELRRAWQLAQAGQRGQDGSPQSGGGAASQGGDGATRGAIGGPEGPVGNAWGGSANGNYGGYARNVIEGDRLRAWDPPLASNALRPMDPADFQRQAEIARRLRSVLKRLPQNALPATDIAALRQLANRLQRTGGDPMEAEYTRMIGLVDQLELAALNASEKNPANAATRAANETADAPEYRETVAEYYRRLGNGK